MSSPGSQPQVLGLDSAGDQQGDTDREGELVALDYDIDTSKGEKALKVRSQGNLSNSTFPM